MKSIFKWTKSHKFEANLIAFLLITMPALPLFLAAQHGSQSWIFGLLGLVIIGNLLELAIR